MTSQHPASDLASAKKLFAENKFDDAKALCEALKHETSCAFDANFLLGGIAWHAKNYTLAEQHFELALTAKPDELDTLQNLGDCKRYLGKSAEAQTLYERGLEISPRKTKFWVSLAILAANRGDNASAFKLLEKALSIDPNYAYGLLHLGRLYTKTGNPEKAKESYYKVLAGDPVNISAHESLVNHLLENGMITVAKKHCDILNRYHPNQPSTDISQARIYNAESNYAAALPLLAKHTVLLNSNIPYTVAYALALSKVESRDKSINILLDCLAYVKDSVDEFCTISFLLAQMYEANRDFDRAWQHSQNANKRRDAVFGKTYSLNDLDQLHQHYSKLGKLPTVYSSSNSTSPVFIIGMPRSGTTLTERILQMHDEVVAGGEMTLMVEIQNYINQATGKPHYAQAIPCLNTQALDKLAHEYQSKLNQFSGNSPFVTDKMPSNAYRLPLIKAIFPKAKIIHCIRHPLDICVSIYMQSFWPTKHPYSFSLQRIAELYKKYNRLMSTWKAIGIEMQDSAYENLVADQAGETRSLLSYCGLAWNDKCLNFHQSSSLILTASRHQANQKIYTQSVGKWQHYEQHLKALKTLLRDEINAYEKEVPASIVGEQ